MKKLLVITSAWTALIYVAGVTNRWWPTPDSAVYLGLGRSLAEGRGYQFNGAFCTDFTPGVPVVLAALHAVFGQAYWAPNVLVALCGFVALCMIYLVMAELAGRRLAFTVTVATALSYAFYFNSHRILSDVPFTAMLWATLYCSLRYRRGKGWWLVGAGLLAAGSIAVRGPGLLVLAPAAVALVVDRPSQAALGKRLLTGVVLLSVILVAGGALLLVARACSRDVPQYARFFLGYFDGGAGGRLAHLVSGLRDVPSAFARLLTSQRGGGFREAAVIMLLLALVGVVSLWKRRLRLIPVLAVVYPIELIVFAGRFEGIRARYLLPIQPVLIFAVMEGLCCCIRAIYRFKSKQPDQQVCAKAASVLALVMIICNTPRTLRHAFYYSVLSHTPRYYQVIDDGEYAELSDVADLIRRDSRPDVRVGMMGRKVGVLHFLSRRRVTALHGRRRRTPTRPGRVARLIAKHDELDFLVLDFRRTDAAFVERLTAAVEAMDQWRLTYQGRRYRVYRRVNAGDRRRVPFARNRQGMPVLC